jgi:hypothetical protein
VATNVAGGGGGSPRPEMVHIHTLSSGFVRNWIDGIGYADSELKFQKAQLNVTNLDTVAHTYTLALLDRWGDFLAQWKYTSVPWLCTEESAGVFLAYTQAQATISPGKTASLVLDGNSDLYFGDPADGLRAVVTEITAVGAPLSPCLPTFEVMTANGYWYDFQPLSRVLLEHFREIVTVGYIEGSPGTPPASTQTRISRGRWREQYNAMMPEHMRERSRSAAASNQRSAPRRSRTKPR